MNQLNKLATFIIIETPSSYTTQFRRYWASALPRGHNFSTAATRGPHNQDSPEIGLPWSQFLTFRRDYFNIFNTRPRDRRGSSPAQARLIGQSITIIPVVTRKGAQWGSKLMPPPFPHAHSHCGYSSTTFAA